MASQNSHEDLVHILKQSGPNFTAVGSQPIEERTTVQHMAQAAGWDLQQALKNAEDYAEKLRGGLYVVGDKPIEERDTLKNLFQAYGFSQEQFMDFAKKAKNYMTKVALSAMAFTGTVLATSMAANADMPGAIVIAGVLAATGAKVTSDLIDDLKAAPTGELGAGRVPGSHLLCLSQLDRIKDEIASESPRQGNNSGPSNK